MCVAHVHALRRRAEHSARLQYPTDRPLLLTQAGDHAHGYVGDHSHGLIEKDPTPLAELEETVYIGQLSNPLNITTTVLAVEVNVTYLGTAVGRVSVPEVSPPLVLGPFESRRSRAFSLLLKAPAATLSRMMADLLKDGEIEVGLYSALDLTFGPDRVRLPYVEELITVALENKGLAGSAAAMQLVDKLAGGQVRSSLEPAEIPAEVEPRSSRGRAEM